MENRKIKIFLKILATFLIISGITFLIGTEKIATALSKIKIEYLILTLLFFILSTFLITLAVKPFIKKEKIWKIFKFKAISWSTGMFLPSKIGEMSFPLLLKSINVPTKKAFAIFFVDRFVSFSIVFVLGILGVFKYFKISLDISYFISFGLAFLGLLLLKNIIKNMKRTKKVISLFTETREYLKSEKKAIFLNYSFSCINFILLFFVTQFIFFLIGEKVSIIDVAFISSLGLLLGLLPITINGIGVREGTLVYLYGLVGVAPEYSILMALVFLVSSYSLGAVFLALFYNEFSFILKKKGTENV